MAEFYRLLKLEELDRGKCPGLLKQVCEWYANHATHTQVASLISEMYHEEVSIQACANYYQQRIWKEQEADRRSYREARNRVKVLLEEQKEDPACDAAKIIEAFTLEGVLAQQGQLGEQDIMQLIAELRKWKRLEADKEIETGKLQVALQNAGTEKERLALDLEKLKSQRERDAKDVKSAVEEKAKDPDALKRRIDEIYGILPFDGNATGDSAAVSGPVGG